ncbi:SGNH/GDSL hydrolase family protein [Pseudarthrobacter sp. PS3-L1]|uniref:SGNH/GDSL hydrolase family protein n=1 Tax=Pseudarthrobacter sp. PS3-L1 TaxID=3046207 RepID=UPI0024BA2FBC|nr:SGNH/GDSL hydrolase family protein [Pseudarthrobacter sp. PS3-L1]MDJ0319933.1 SGNH/GDSL hydrolase family protein [Pseudarthrobacter sp. PS3-L1]
MTSALLAAALSHCSSAQDNSPASAHSIVIVGDSLSTGYGTSAADAWPQLVNNDAAFVRGHPVLRNTAQNGSGYVSVGEEESTFATEVAEAVSPTTRLVVFFGSENDIGFPLSDVGAAASEAYANVKSLAPSARLLVIGPVSTTPDIDPELVAVRDQAREAALHAGAFFVDPIAEGWIMDNSAELIGPDGDHPTVAGQIFLKDQMERLISEHSSS